MAINGNNIIVYSNGTAIAGTKSDTISVSGSLIEIASPSDGAWEHFIAGRKNWSLNVGWLVSTAPDIRKVLQVGTRVQLKIKGRGDSDANGLTGYTIMQTADISAIRGSLATGSFKFKGDGPLT
jgi:predicted secreted protein